MPPVPPLQPEVRRAVQDARDEDHLRLLEIGFYISGVLTALRFLWFGIIAVFFAFGGLAAILANAHGSQSPANGPPPAFVLFFLAIIFGTMILLTLVFAALEIYAGVCLKNRRHPVLIQIVAAFYCLSIPWGTALGVFTFMVLNRPSVKPLFLR
jgi:uncharacterized membrane protein